MGSPKGSASAGPVGHETFSTLRLTGTFGEAIQRVRASQEQFALLVYHCDGAKRVLLSPDAPVVVGRGSLAQLQLRDPSLSREHARFTLSRGVVTVEDLGSTNGTWVGGARVKSGEARAGDKVLLGSVAVSICSLAPDERLLAGLMRPEDFQRAIEEEVARARFFQRTFALLIVRADSGGDESVERWLPTLRALLRPVDRTAVVFPGVVGALMIESSVDAARELASALVGARAEGTPALLAGVAGFPDAATTPDKLFNACWRAAHDATAGRPVQAAPSTALVWSGDSTRARADGDSAAVVVSPAMRRVFAEVAKLAPSSIHVLLHGETGTGKEVVARAIHAQGSRRARPMVCVNCGAIPQQLLESTLFGHERGAFTGATEQRKGVFESAHGGTVLLDEIGELPAAAQAAMLRVLETRRVTRVGSSREIDVDVRIIAATHRDLEAMCAAGVFRLDLLYRLNAITLAIPALRERPEDIEPLALRFLRQASASSGRDLRGFEPGVLALLRSYPWPGNVRELRNAVERAVLVSDGAWIRERDLPERVRSARAADTPLTPAVAQGGVGSGGVVGSGTPSASPAALAPLEGAADHRARMQRYEDELIAAALREAGGNQTEAARTLRMPLRTLVHKLRALRNRRTARRPPDSRRG